MTDQPPLAPGGHYGDHQPRTVRDAPHWDSSLESLGRWVILESPPGRAAVVLFTDDHDRMGVIPMSAADNPNAPGVASHVSQALRSAKAGGAASVDVFAWWAGQADQHLVAGPVQSGALEGLAGYV